MYFLYINLRTKSFVNKWYEPAKCYIAVKETIALYSKPSEICRIKKALNVKV